MVYYCEICLGDSYLEFLSAYGYIGIFLLVAFLVGLVFPLIPLILTLLKVVPRKPSTVKSSTYECGMEPVGEAWVQFNFRYYFYALLYVVFAIETVFLYPWAVAFRQLKLFGLIEMLIFILILVVGLAYAWKKGALEWK